jgi:hypothetical protein
MPLGMKAKTMVDGHLLSISFRCAPTVRDDDEPFQRFRQRFALCEPRRGVSRFSSSSPQNESDKESLVANLHPLHEHRHRGEQHAAAGTNLALVISVRNNTPLTEKKPFQSSEGEG